ncbi:MAG: hypothetical protein IJO34_01440 [Akkermansia sp.]|nr:hypothetical protein [Akkermansia sp.]
MNIKTQKGKMYAVCSGLGCTVATENGMVLCTVAAGAQACFVAPDEKVTISDDAAIVTETFNGAATAALGGGSGVTIDQTFSSTSENAQSGVAVQKAIYANNLSATSTNTILGLLATSNNRNYCTCVGHKAVSNAEFGTAVGYGAVSQDCSVSVGVFAQCLKAAGFSIGYTGTNNDLGVGLFSVADGRNVNINTCLYLIGANTPLANKYEGGEACLGYVVKAKDGTILGRGTRKLSELLTNNTDFAPASMDLDAPAPTPFMPTGITDPIEWPEEPGIS